MKKTIAVWFSCGAASAIAAKLTIDKFKKDYNILVVNNPVTEEHPDNRRFLKDVEEYIQHSIIEAKNPKYPSCSIVDVFERERYMSGVQGAVCTRLLKREARYHFEIIHRIDYHILGFTVDEWKRQKNFMQRERADVIPLLCSELITKEDCFSILRRAGIKLPKIYELLYPNANCIGCIKSESPTYWNMVRVDFPEVFIMRAVQSREIGCKLVKYKGKRIFLDELPPDAVGGKIKNWECGIFCDNY